MSLQRNEIKLSTDILDFCSNTYQKKCAEAVIRNQEKSGKWKRAAKELGLTANQVRMTVRTVRNNAAKRGYSPRHDMINTCPESFSVSGVSTLYDDAGNVKVQWVKTKAEDEHRELAMRALFDELKQDLTPAKSVDLECDTDNALLNLYTITDYHFGMYAWSEEAGEEWSSDIAEITLDRAINDMIERSPSAKIGFLNIQGDFMHYDSLTPVTPAHKNVLDADMRYQQLIRTALRMIRLAIDKMQRKHEKVVLLVAEGNHDESGSKWLQEAFSMFYEQSPRVDVVVSPSPFYCFKHGDTMLAFHHGHKADLSKFAQVIPAQFPAEWGQTKYRYGHLGHRHHKQVKENHGITIEQHQTLATKDAHAARGGYFAERGATSITYSEACGEVSRITVRPR